MKKKIITAILAISCSCVGLTVGTAFADPCGVAKVVSVGIENEKIFVFLKNISGAACGTGFANGATQQYYLNSVQTDQTYATLLTAISLQKNLWVNLGGTSASGSLLLTTSMQN
jgi:hypothetical protein